MSTNMRRSIRSTRRRIGTKEGLLRPRRHHPRTPRLLLLYASLGGGDGDVKLLFGSGSTNRSGRHDNQFVSRRRNGEKLCNNSCSSNHLNSKQPPPSAYSRVIKTFPRRLLMTSRSLVGENEPVWMIRQSIRELTMEWRKFIQKFVFERSVEFEATAVFSPDPG